MISYSYIITFKNCKYSASSNLVKYKHGLHITSTCKLQMYDTILYRPWLCMINTFMFVCDVKKKYL